MPLPNDPNHPFYKRPSFSRPQKVRTVANRRKRINLPENLAKLSISVLDLSVRSRNALLANATKTVGELALLSDTKLLKLQNFGHKSLIDVHQALDQFLVKHAADCPDVASLDAEDSVQPPKTDMPRRSSGGWIVPAGGEDHIEETGDDRLKAPIEVLDLSTRPTNVLNRLQITTVGELLIYPKHRMFDAENMGRKSLNEVESKVFAYLSGKQAGNECSLGTASPRSSLGTRAFVDQILQILPERQRNIIKDRYGLWDGIAETLQDIGDKLGLTRERIRQIEGSGLKRIHRQYKHGAMRRYIVQRIRSEIYANGLDRCGIIGEDEALSALAIGCTEEEAELAVAFLQDIDSPGESVFSNSLIEIEARVYCVEYSTADSYRELLHLMQLILKSRDKPLTEGLLTKELEARAGRVLTPTELLLAKRVLSLSSRVCRLRNGTVALAEWIEFSGQDAPRLAEAALKLLGAPAHFREITEKANTIAGEARALTAGTIHNALTGKPEKFVRLKSGTYGLAAWGLKKPPYVKDRLVELLSEAAYPLPLWHLEKKVLEVCNCKPASIRMTLDLNPTVFKKFEGDQYGLRKHF